MKKTNFKDYFFKKKFEKKKNPKGDVFKILDRSSKNYYGFGEIYISSLNSNASKDWNLHKKMILNLFVIKGKVKFLIKKNNKIFSILTIKAKTWVKMINLNKKKSELINFASLKHDKSEMIKSKIL